MSWQPIFIETRFQIVKKKFIMNYQWNQEHSLLSSVLPSKIYNIGYYMSTEEDIKHLK